jgi:hypothetical protein
MGLAALSRHLPATGTHEDPNKMYVQQIVHDGHLADAGLSNIRAAELHEEVARWHRAAAEYHSRLENGLALHTAATAHLKCNEAFDATIAAHAISADVTPLEHML